MAHGYLGDGFGEHGEIEPGGNDDRDHDRRRNERKERGSGDRDRDRGWMFADDERRERTHFSADPDDHYRNWRERHMAELDRDYEDYCREREREFHRRFDEWRRSREQSRATDTDMVLEDERVRRDEALSGPEPIAEATLGTNNSENANPGRGGRSR
jgi:hypothetical protein